MPSFEGLVRPFTNLSAPPTRGLLSVPTPTANAVLVVTGGGQVKSGTYNYGFSIQCYADATHQERTSSGEPGGILRPLPGAARPPQTLLSNTMGVRTPRGLWLTRRR